MSGPLHVWVPVKDRHDLTAQFIDNYQHQTGNHRLHIIDNGSTTEPTWEWPNTHRHDGTIHDMWNYALDHTPLTSVAVLANNDVIMQDDNVIEALEELLAQHRHVGVASPHHGFQPHNTESGDPIEVPPTVASQGGCAGFFMAIPPRTHHTYRFPPYRWWFGDADLFFHVHYLHGRACAVHTGVHIEHIGGGSQTPAPPTRDADIEHDRAMFDERWG